MLWLLFSLAFPLALANTDAIQECLAAANLSATLEMNSTVLYAYLTNSQTGVQAQILACISQHSNTSAAIVPYELDEYLEELDEDPWDTTANSTSTNLKRATCKRPYYSGSTHYLTELFIATVAKFVNNQAQLMQTKWGFECGRCYSWENNISKNIYIENNTGEEISFMWWEHHECRHKSPSGKNTHKGRIGKVAVGATEVFKAKEGSFYIQCDDEWPDEATGKKVNWPVKRIKGFSNDDRDGENDDDDN